MKSITKENLAYIAGIVDGEGCLSLTGGKRLAYDSRGKKYRAFQLTFRVVNTSRVLIEWLNQTSGIGTVRLLADHLDNRKPVHSWLISANDCRQILPLLLPYLVIKRRQAEIIIDWLKRISGKRGTRMNPTVFAEKLKIVEEMKILNKRGIR
jgi:hypothetical protein